MKTHRITEIGICCMRSDCRDHDCPGRELARLYQAEGGVQVRNGKTVRALVSTRPARRARHSLTFILLAAAVAVSVVTAFSF